MLTFVWCSCFRWDCPVTGPTQSSNCCVSRTSQMCQNGSWTLWTCPWTLCRHPEKKYLSVQQLRISVSLRSEVTDACWDLCVASASPSGPFATVLKQRNHLLTLMTRRVYLNSPKDRLFHKMMFIKNSVFMFWPKCYVRNMRTPNWSFTPMILIPKNTTIATDVFQETFAL